LSGFGAQEAREILFVGHRQEAFDEVSSALADKAGVYRVDWLANPRLAPARVAERAPDVILVDDDLGGPDPVQLIRRLLLRAPGSLILAMVGEHSISMASQAIMAGARGFVARPIKPADLVATLELALDRDPSLEARRGASEKSKGRVVVFCSSRGGSGLTTLVTNTAVALASSSGSEVALVDADLGAPAVDVALNLQGRHDLRDLLSGASDLDTAIVKDVLTEHASGVRALLAPQLNEAFDLPDARDIQEITLCLRSMFAWVLVDLGLPQDDIALAYLDAADRIIVNVLPEMVGLRNARHLIEIMLERGYPADRIWLVVSRCPSEGAIHRQDIERRMHVPVVYQVPNDYPLALHSLNRGVPLVVSHPRSALGRALRTFANEIFADAGRSVELPADVRADRGWLGRLLMRARTKVTGVGVETKESEAWPAYAPAAGVELDVLAPQSGESKVLRPFPEPMAARAEGGQVSLDLSDSLLVEACPYLGLANDPEARYPYPCTANHCCSADVAVPVDPSYQASTCFGGNWTPCPRFVESVTRSAEGEGEAGQAGEERRSEYRRDAALVGAPESTQPEASPGDRTAQAAGDLRDDQRKPAADLGVDDLSGSFVLQACPFLGMRGDDSARLPYPDAENCCFARGEPRDVDAAFQASTCFLGDWDQCPHYNSGLEDSFEIGPERSGDLLGMVNQLEEGAEDERAVSDVEAGDQRDESEAAQEGQPNMTNPWLASAPSEATSGLDSDESKEALSASGGSDDSPMTEVDSSLSEETAEEAGSWSGDENQEDDLDELVRKLLGDEAQPGPVERVDLSEFDPTAQVADSPAMPPLDSWMALGSRGDREDDTGRSEESPAMGSRSGNGDAANEGLNLSSHEEWGRLEDRGPSESISGAPRPAPSDRETRPAGARDLDDVDLFHDLSDGCPYLGLLNDPTTRHPFPDTANCCHAQGTAFSLLPSYQLSYCLGPKWRECARWKKASKRNVWSGVSIPRDMGIPRETLERETRLPCDGAVPDSGNDAVKMSSDGLPLREPETPDAVAESAVVAESAAVAKTASEKTGVPPEAEEEPGRCPHLGLSHDPDSYVASPTLQNHCHAFGEPSAVSLAYQAGTCLKCYWRHCPRYAASGDVPDDAREDSAQAGHVTQPNRETCADDQSHREKSAPSSVAPESGGFRDRSAGPEDLPDGNGANKQEPMSEALETAEPEDHRDLTSGSLETGSHCPHLGLQDDSGQCVSEPDKTNYCHARRVPFSVMPSYQARVCLTEHWDACPRFINRQSGAEEPANEEETDGEPVRTGFGRWMRSLIGL